MRTRFLVLALAGTLLSAGVMSSAQARSARAGSTPALDSFIVVLHPGIAPAGAVAGDHAARFGVELSHVYEHALDGYAAGFPGELADVIGADPLV